MDNGVMDTGTGIWKDDQIVFKDEILTGYTEYKNKLDTELKANAEGFVRIGYLLKVARDTDILRESGYKNVAEFAQAEYGLTKDIVSIYIAINDKYAENGYSDKLQSKFEGFGVAKLQEMLTLPDAIIEEIEPTLTKREIVEIKKEVAAEEAITPIEVAIEAATPEVQMDEREFSITERIWKEFFHENKDIYKALEKDLTFMAAYAEVWTEERSKKAGEALMNILAPNGDTVLWSRVPGTGKFMISINTDDGTIVYTNIRTSEKTKGTVAGAESDIHEVFADCTPTNWSLTFGEEFEKSAPAPEKKSEPDPKENEATKHYQDEIKAYKEKTGWDPNADWTPEKGKEYEEKEKVAPVQPKEDFMPKPGSWTYEKSKENTQEENKHEEERSKETDGSRTGSNENRKVQESTADITKLEGCKERIRAERLGQLNVGDGIVNVDDGTRGTMLGYCAGEYKIQTETGLILVSESSTRWKKEDIIEAEKVTEVKTDDNDSEDRAAEEEKLKTAVEIIRDKLETISTICLELKCQDYSADDIAKSFEGIADIAEKIKQTAKDYLNSKGAGEDGND